MTAVLLLTGHNLGWGTQAVADLAPHTEGGQTFREFCEAQTPGSTCTVDGVENQQCNPAQQASLAACNGIPSDTIAQACAAMGGPAPAIVVMCMDLGWDQATCEGIAEDAVAAGVTSCPVLVAVQGQLCQGVADGTGSTTCDEWAPGNGYIGGAPSALNVALGQMAQDQLGLLNAACTSVALNADAACADHAIGHLCAHVDLSGGEPCQPQFGACLGNEECAAILAAAPEGQAPDLETCMANSLCGELFQCMMDAGAEDSPCPSEMTACTQSNACIAILQSAPEGQPPDQATCMADEFCGPLMQCMMDSGTDSGGGSGGCDAEIGSCLSDASCAAIALDPNTTPAICQANDLCNAAMLCDQGSNAGGGDACQPQVDACFSDGTCGSIASSGDMDACAGNELCNALMQCDQQNNENMLCPAE